MNRANSPVKIVWLLAAVLSYSLGKELGMGRRWVGGRNKLFVKFKFLLMFERPIHFRITLEITYVNNLLMKILTKIYLFDPYFQDSESFVL